MRRTVPAFFVLLMTPLAQSQVVPTEFANDRILVIASAANGVRVRFFTDTGGGWNAISVVRNAADQIGDMTVGVADAEDGFSDRTAGKTPPALDEQGLRNLNHFVIPLPRGTAYPD
jgi:hypothetical protein